ncbi:MAG: hypothetical protein ACR2G3_04465 [Solirubrobacterales bacterium]
MTDHLRPTAPIAGLAVLPGDPGRALVLAQDLLEGPLMANHARGLWGYTAKTRAGVELTVQSTGLGGPSIAIVLEELASLGVRRAIRLGTCRSIAAGLEAGALAVAVAALPAPGEGEAGPAKPDEELSEALLRAGEGALLPVTIAETSRYYDPDATTRDEARLAAGAQAVDLATATMFEVAARLGVEVASALVIARAGDRALSDEEVETASLRLGRLASAALRA